MDYGALLKDAWRITWRHKYLWVLGLLAGEAGGCNFTFGTGDWNPTTVEEQFPSVRLDGVEDWFATYWGLIAAAALMVLVLGVVLFIISMIAKAGLVVGVDDIALRRHDAGLGRAWRGGTQRFGRLLGMYLLVALGIILVLVIAGALIAIPIVSWTTTGAEPGAAGVLILVLLVLLLVFLAVPAAVALQLVTTWGTRSLVLDGTGVGDSLRTGWRLLRRRLGVSLLLYLLSLAVGFAAALAIGLVFVVVGLPVALGIIASDGVGGLTWLAIALAGLVLVALGVLVGAITGTFFSTYWTLAYRRLFPPERPQPRLVSSGPAWTDHAAVYPPRPPDAPLH